MVKKRKLPKLKEILKTCAWCSRRIGSDTPVFSLGAKGRQGVDLSKYEKSGVMPMVLALQEKHLYSLVSRSGSDAKKAGNDLIFLLCSEECAKNLKTALEEETSLGNILEDIHSM